MHVRSIKLFFKESNLSILLLPRGPQLSVGGLAWPRWDSSSQAGTGCVCRWHGTARTSSHVQPAESPGRPLMVLESSSAPHEAPRQCSNTCIPPPFSFLSCTKHTLRLVYTHAQAHTHTPSRLQGLANWAVRYNEPLSVVVSVLLTYKA